MFYAIFFSIPTAHPKTLILAHVRFFGTIRHFEWYWSTFYCVLFLALVEFVDPFDAKKAFTRLAYSKFKNVPLFLEWAPEQSLAPKLHTQPKSEHENNVGHENPIESVKEEAEEEEEPEPDTTLFVKNLHFDTTDEVLRQVRRYLFSKKFTYKIENYLNEIFRMLYSSCVVHEL